MENPLQSKGDGHIRSPGIPDSGTSRQSRDWANACHKHTVLQSSQLPHHLLLSGHLFICALPIQDLPKSQDVTICLLLDGIKLSVCAVSKKKFPSGDVTRPVRLASFPCPFAYPSGALSDSGHQPRCLLCMMDVVRDALIGGLLLLPSHSYLSP